ncbi:MAG: hypothetical protein HYX42_19955 [Polaromonas sp.]|uniref:gamma-mobile-trio integrase GmtZ n=1 Tax=Polaromonas sp. TaxID=1869339 RepID=UPI0025CC983D|nr:VPA1269 family protein [Polaromonas sp.]MBI2728518.1 hypothetical protein [Polaromonas sp.]
MANYTNHSNNKPLATELIAEIKRRVEVNGEKKTHVALELGISHSAVRKYTAPKPHLITKETKDEVIALVKKGASNSEVAKRLGISRCTVGKLTPGKKRELLTEQIKATLVDRVESGESVAAVARNLRIDYGNARRILENATGSPTLAPLPASMKEDALYKRVLGGESILTVAKQLLIGVKRAYSIGSVLMKEPDEKQIGEIKAYLADEKSPEHISETLQVRLTHVYRLQDEPVDLISTGAYVSNATKNRAVVLLQAGLSRVEVAKRLNVDRRIVGLLPTNHTRFIGTEIQQKVVEGVYAGKSVAQIARELQIDLNWAHKIVNASIPDPSKKEVETIRNMQLSGKSRLEIAVELKFPQKTIAHVLGPRVKTLGDAEELSIAEAISLGQAYKDVTKRHGINLSRVKAIYRKYSESGLVKSRISINMEDDRELNKIQRMYPEYDKWRQYALAYYKVRKGNFAVLVTGIHRFFEFLSENSLYPIPADFLLKSNSKYIPSFYELKGLKSDHGAAINNAIVDFIDWILHQDEFVDTNDDDVPETLGIFRNPLRVERRADHRVQRNSESNKVVMPYWMVHDLRRRLIQGPNFTDWRLAQSLNGKETLSGDKEAPEWFEVSENRIDRSDPDCVWRLRELISSNEPVLEMWSPVRTVAVLLKLQTTARLGQIRMLDSGEADLIRYVGGRFVPNSGPLASGTKKRPREQGAIRNGSDGTAVLYFNTNKTQDINKVGSEKGFECPWPHLDDYRDDPYWLISKLARWQEKYNPVGQPVAWKDVPSSRRLRGKSEVVCSTYPDAMFLLRTAESIGQEMFPVGYSSCYRTWTNLLITYEKLLIQESVAHSDGSNIELTEDGRALVSPHGLRVSLITHLITDGGMPLEMMVRIVGHVNFLMTIYYVKPGMARLQEALKSATAVLDAKKDHTLIRDLKSMQLEELRNRVVNNACDLSDVIQSDPSSRNPLGWLEMLDGICLAGGNTGPVAGDYHVAGCHNGGPQVNSNAEKGIHGLVPGGIRNCSRCRWKCSGKKHLLALQAAYNNKNYWRSKAGQTAIDTERKRFEILEKKARAENSGLPFMEIEELAQAERHHLAAMHQLEQLAADMLAIQLTIEKVLQLPEEPGKLSLVSRADEKTLETIIEDVDSSTVLLCEVVEDVEFWPELEPGNAVFELTRLLDTAFEREGHVMKLAHLSNEEQLTCCNAIMRDLGSRANPENPRLGRRLVARTIDRMESLREVLGVSSLAQVIPSKNKLLGSTPLLLQVKRAQ